MIRRTSTVLLSNFKLSKNSVVSRPLELEASRPWNIVWGVQRLKVVFFCGA